MAKTPIFTITLNLPRHHPVTARLVAYIERERAREYHPSKTAILRSLVTAGLNAKLAHEEELNLHTPEEGESHDHEDIHQQEN